MNFSSLYSLSNGVWLMSALLLLIGCSQDSAVEQVNVYSYRKEALIKPLLEQFTEQTGIQVNLVTGKADALLQRLLSEGQNTPADVLLTVDAGRLYRAKTAGVLRPVDSAILRDAVPAHLRDPEQYWFGLSYRARVIMYNTAKVQASELSSYEGLTDARWQGRICVRSSNNIYNQSLLASMIAHLGEAAAEQWANGIVANMARPPTGNDSSQMRGAAVGECDIAIANSYYLGAWLNTDDPEQQAMANSIAVFYPNQQDRGTHINISGAGITQHAKHPQNARKLLEFLVSDTAQQWYANANNEYPVKPGIPVSDTVQSWGYPFKTDDLNLNVLGELNATAVMVFDRAGWR